MTINCWKIQLKRRHCGVLKVPSGLTTKISALVLTVPKKRRSRWCMKKLADTLINQLMVPLFEKKAFARTRAANFVPNASRAVPEYLYRSTEEAT